MMGSVVVWKCVKIWRAQKLQLTRDTRGLRESGSGAKAGYILTVQRSVSLVQAKKLAV